MLVVALPVLIMRVSDISAFRLRLCFLINGLPVFIAHILVFRLCVLLLELRAQFTADILNTLCSFIYLSAYAP